MSGRLIDADKLIEIYEWYKGQVNEWRKEEIDEIIKCINEQPTVDAVSKGLFEQIKWERDIAIAQLEQIGCQLGQKMDDVSPVVRCKDCVYWTDEDGIRELGDGTKVARCNVHNHYIGLRHYGWCPTENDFCSYGERKEE